MRPPARDPQTVVVTGAATGIGRATAVAFARLGCWVLIADRNAARAEETLALVRAAGGDGRVRALDVTDLADLRAAVDEVVAERGRIDVLVNNAGRPMAIRIEDIDEAQFDAVLDVNLKATFFACKYVIEHMLVAGGGAIVNTASDMGLVAGLPNQPAYVASKGAVVLLTKALAVDYAEQDIRVNCVCPCLTDTPMIDDFLATQFPDDAERAKVKAELHAIQPIARMNTPAEVASAIVFLGTPASSGTTGVALPVDGGFVAR
ncbi:SDR family oxidoreductase [Baekduia soli]|uniref:SDR family oxidoreductase n=1 Tax=Baekduia soli TaxID=496014 RepID=A0A5B8U614_9ACTN|nr:SDR family oxidoreductase [Baekduia soli]QEC48427.1 SDR family oxidoreductase [Baekduia soli]